MLPVARSEQLTIQEMPEETLIFDHEHNQAHCLNRTAAHVWKHCDGRTSTTALAALLKERLGIEPALAVVELALEQLGKRRLLEGEWDPLAERRRSRRDALVKLSTAALVLPVVMTIAAPRASAAASLACSTNADCSSLTNVGGCIVGTCQSGRCTTTQAANGTSCGGAGFACMNGACVQMRSDRGVKDRFTAVNVEQVLAAVATLPIEGWCYQGEDIRHIGPMAQDFAAAFHLGEDDKHINLIDANGVALAAIQALYRIAQHQDEQIHALRAEVQELKGQVAATAPLCGYCGSLRRQDPPSNALKLSANK